MYQKTLLSLLLIGAVLLSAVPAAGAQTGQPLIVAYIGASRGSQAAAGQLLYQAAVLAAEQINAAGDGLYAQGVAGPDGTHYYFEVLYYPADSDAEALEALADAVADGAVAVLGPDPAGRVSAILEAGTPDIPVLYGAPDAPESDTNAFHLSAGYDDWAGAVADYLANVRSASEVAVAAADTETTQTHLDTFVDAIEAAGSEVVLNLTHPADADDLYADAMEIRTSGADAALIWTMDAQAALLLQSLQAIGWDGLAVYVGLDEGFAGSAGASVAAGAAGPVSWSAAAYDPLSQTFVDQYVSRWNIAPPDHAAAYFDAVYLLAEAVAAGGSDPDDIAGALDDISDYYGVQGVYDSAQTGDLRMVQFTAGGALAEAARYTAGVCANCPDTWWPDTSSVTEAGSEVLTLALVATLDGAAEARGLQAQQAAQMAVREINDAGGIIGPDDTRYMLFLESHNATDADAAATAITEAAAGGAVAILGPDYNAQVTPNLLLASQAGVPQLVTATDAYIPETDPTDYVFQVRPNDAALAAASAAYMLDARDYTNFATVAVRTDYALGAVDALVDVIIESEHGQLVCAIEHGLDDSDYAGMAAQLAGSGAEGVFMWTTPAVLLGLMDELAAQGWTGTLVYGYLTPELLDIVNVPDGIELTGPVNWWPVSGGALASQQFIERYADRYGTTPTAQSAAYYDAVYLVAYAIQEAGAAPAAIQAWLADASSITGVQGTYRPATYGQGEMTQSVMLVQVTNGEASTVARYDGLVCMAGCGEVAMGEALAWDEEDAGTSTSTTTTSSTDTAVVYTTTVTTSTSTTTTSTAADTTTALDIYPSYESCQLSGNTYTCTGWVNVEGGTQPYMVWINGSSTPNTDGIASLRISGPKCAAVMYDVEAVDATGQIARETFYFDPNNEPDKSLFPLTQQCGYVAPAGGRPQP